MRSRTGVRRRGWRCGCAAAVRTNRSSPSSCRRHVWRCGARRARSRGPRWAGPPSVGRGRSRRPSAVTSETRCGAWHPNSQRCCSRWCSTGCRCARPAFVNWTLPVAWLSTSLFAPPPRSTPMRVVTWPLLPPGTAAGTWTALALTVVGTAGYAVAGPRRRRVARPGVHPAARRRPAHLRETEDAERLRFTGDRLRSPHWFRTDVAPVERCRRGLRHGGSRHREGRSPRRPRRRALDARQQTADSGVDTPKDYRHMDEYPFGCGHSPCGLDHTTADARSLPTSVRDSSITRTRAARIGRFDPRHQARHVSTTPGKP